MKSTVRFWVNAATRDRPHRRSVQLEQLRNVQLPVWRLACHGEHDQEVARGAVPTSVIDRDLRQGAGTIIVIYSSDS